MITPLESGKLSANKTLCLMSHSTLFQATRDALTGDYGFRAGEGDTRDQYLKDNNITTYIITAFNDDKIINNNDEIGAKTANKKSPPDLKGSAGSPVLSIVNLPKIFVTSAAGEESTLATPGIENWAPEIPFENLTTAESGQIEMIVGNSLGKLDFRNIWSETCPSYFQT